MPSQRRSPPPWTIEEHTETFIVRNATGQALAYFYFEEKPGRRSAAKLLTRDEAHGRWCVLPVSSPSCHLCTASRSRV